MTILLEPQYWVIKTIVDYLPESRRGDLDQFGACFTPNPGNCSGVTNWMRIQPGTKERALYYRCNPDSGGYTTARKFQWAIREIPGGAIFAPNGEAGVWQIPSIFMASKGYAPGLWNVIKVVEEIAGYKRAECIPTELLDVVTYQTHPYYFMNAYNTNQRGQTSEPVGGFRIPYFNPATLEHHGEFTGFWIKNSALKMRVSLDEIVPPVEVVRPIGFEVIATKRTVMRQGPRATAVKIDPDAQEGERFWISDQINGWGYTGKRRGWILMADTRKA